MSTIALPPQIASSLFSDWYHSRYTQGVTDSWVLDGTCKGNLAPLWVGISLTEFIVDSISLFLKFLILSFIFGFWLLVALPIPKYRVLMWQAFKLNASFIGQIAGRLHYWFLDARKVVYILAGRR